MNRDALERWVGFVFTTIKRHQQESLCVRWEAHMRPLAHGLATLDRDLFSASVLAIDLARLTTAAEEASNRERARCSPFSVPSMEEQGVQWAVEVPPPPPAPENYTLGQLVEDLRRFGADYHQAAERIQEEDPIIQKHSRIQLGAFVSLARDSLQRIPGFTELREQARSLWDEEISFVSGRQIVDALVQRSNGRLSTGAAEALTLAEAVAGLTAPPGAFRGHNAAAEPATGSRVVLRGPGGRPIVCGVEKRPLTLPQYDVVNALLESGERGLSKDELDRKSRHGDARKILTRLASSDPDWKAVICFPGRTGGGYRIG
jgi:hypothetical protein